MAIGRSSGRGIRANALIEGLGGLGKEVVVGDIHFVISKGMDRKMAGGMGRVRVHRLVEERRGEGCVVRRQGRGRRIYRHETVSRYIARFEDLAEVPARVRTRRRRRIRVHSKVRSGIGRTPSRSACHVEEKGNGGREVHRRER